MLQETMKLGLLTEHIFKDGQHGQMIHYTPTPLPPLPVHSDQHAFVWCLIIVSTFYYHKYIAHALKPADHATPSAFRDRRPERYY